MQPGMAELAFGKCMLTRTLCLPLLLALRHQLETGERPPSTPFPGRGRQQHRDSLPPPCPPEDPGHHPDDTNEKPLAPPPGRKDRDKEKEKEKEKKPTTGDKGPDPRVEQKPKGEGSDGDEEGPPPQTPLPPPTGEGEGEVEGGPRPGPSPVPVPAPTPGRGPEEGLLPGLASRLMKWEHEFDQLVQDITGDLHDYWLRLKTPH